MHSGFTLRSKLLARARACARMPGGVPLCMGDRQWLCVISCAGRWRGAPRGPRVERFGGSPLPRQRLGARGGQHLLLPRAAADRSAAQGVHGQDRHQGQRRVRLRRPQRAPGRRGPEQPRRRAAHRRCRPPVGGQGCRATQPVDLGVTARTQSPPSSAIPTITGSA